MAAFNLASKMAAKLSFQSFLSSLRGGHRGKTSAHASILLRLA